MIIEVFKNYYKRFRRRVGLLPIEINNEGLFIKISDIYNPELDLKDKNVVIEIPLVLNQNVIFNLISCISNCKNVTLLCSVYNNDDVECFKRISNLFLGYRNVCGFCIYSNNSLILKKCSLYISNTSSKKVMAFVIFSDKHFYELEELYKNEDYIDELCISIINVSKNMLNLLKKFNIPVKIFGVHDNEILMKLSSIDIDSIYLLLDEYCKVNYYSLRNEK